MKKLNLLWLAFITPIAGHALNPVEPTCACFDKDSLLEFKVGAFIPSYNLYDEIYGKSVVYNLEYTTYFCRNFDFYASLGYVYDSGRSIGLGNRTSINLIPISAGFKYFSPLSFFCDRANFYVGLGAVITHVDIHDHSPFVIPVSAKWAGGGIMKSGILYKINSALYFDLFADYTFSWVDFHDTNNGAVVRNRASLSGFVIGAGIGAKLGSLVSLCRSS